VVKHFLRQGHTVSVVARRPPVHDDETTARVNYWQLDIRDAAAVAETVPNLISTHGKINYLVFFQRYRGEDDIWQAEIETSLTATKIIVEQLQDHFAEGDKSIVIVTSIAAHLIGPSLPISYQMAKAALCQMVRYWAVSLGPRGIRVNSVSPGTVLKEESKEFYLGNAQLSKLYQRLTPLRRYGHASEVAQVIGCFCSTQTSFVTGQDIVVDGGVSLQWQEWLARELLDIPQSPGANVIKAGQQ
jgi:NAD(P)-dependent dehydrogenase (short-subunit alcohol dehydrogenase family)